MLLFLPLGWGERFAAAPQSTLAVVLSSEAAEYHQILTEITSALRNSPHFGFEVRPITASSLNDHPQLLPKDSDLVIAVGMRALKEVVHQSSDSNIFTVMVPRLSYLKFLERWQKETAQDGAHGFSALFIDQPVERQLRLVKALKGGFSSVGILVGPDSRLDKAALKSQALRLGISLRWVEADSARDVVTAIKRSKNKIDSLILVFDPMIINSTTIKQILYFSYNDKLPVIGYSAALVKAGAAAAVYSTATQIGRQAGEAVVDILDTSFSALPEKAYPAYFSASCNEAVMRYFNLNPNCDLSNFVQQEEQR